MATPFALKTPFYSAITPSGEAKYVWWFIFANTKLLVHSPGNSPIAICTLSPEQLDLTPIFTKYLGRYADADCFVASLTDEQPAFANMTWRDLRSLFAELDHDIFCLAGRAIQIVHWYKEHRYCGKCGTAMLDRQNELARKCPGCEFISYPRLSPAVIMSVVRDEQILLARSPRFPAGMYSTLAGFVEPGETLEEAVRREVLEEVGIEIENIEYVASQPWPFPHSLMIGFTSTYKSGDIRVDPLELEDAQWFSASSLPQLPSKISISRLLIENFISKMAEGG